MCFLSSIGEAIDNVTVSEQLARERLLECVGGRGYLAELIEAVPSITNLPSHCRVVQERSRERQLRYLCRDFLSRIGRESIASLLEEIEESIFALEQGANLRHGKPIGLLTTEQLHRLQDLYNGKTAITGLSTGFADLDAVTAGLHPGNLVVIGGRPGMGKTDLALNMATYVALKGRQVLFFSLEMSEGELTNRILSAQASVAGQALRTAQIDAAGWRRLAEASTRLETSSLKIDDSGSLTLAQLRNRSRLHKSKHGLALVVVDYLQLMQGRSDAATREQEVSDLSRSLKVLAKELGVPIIALSQLNRSVELRKPQKPKLADLRESGGIEQDADVVMMLYREDYYDENTERKGLADVLIEKQRNGPLTELPLIYQGKLSRFLDKSSLGQESK
jgi:replicative DNA helicase